MFFVKKNFQILSVFIFRFYQILSVTFFVGYFNVRKRQKYLSLVLLCVENSCASGNNKLQRVFHQHNLCAVSDCIHFLICAGIYRARSAAHDNAARLGSR